MAFKPVIEAGAPTRISVLSAAMTPLKEIRQSETIKMKNKHHFKPLFFVILTLLISIRFMFHGGQDLFPAASYP
jgi:hypothetical protein